MKISRSTISILIAVLVASPGALPFAVQPVEAQASCDRNTVVFERGFYGQYYNMAEDDLGMQSGITNYTVGIAEDNYWFTPEYRVFDRTDPSINFGTKFFPVDAGKIGDPYHFAVHWRSAFVVSATGEYEFRVTSNNDSWLVIDDTMLLNLGNAKFAKNGVGKITLTKGVHELNSYFTERHTPGSQYSFTVTGSALHYFPLPPSCTMADARSFGLEALIAGNDSGKDEANGSDTSRGRVLGASTTDYTPAIALVKTADSPDVYALYANGFRHYISSPAAFNNYGYDFTTIRTISHAALNKYPDARLLRTPENPTVYFLSTRPNRQWLKIAIPSPTALISYPNNYWGNVVVVDELDINAYPNAELIKTKDSPAVYLLGNNQRRRFLSGDVFTGLGYKWPEILIISNEHMGTYVEGPPIG